MQEETQSELKARATKEELVAEIERLNAVVKDLQDQLNQQVAVVRTGKRGWMVSTPNPAYTGRTAGLYFENGHAFIPEGLNNARRLVATLITDFGYSVTETDDGREITPPAPKKQGVLEAVTRPQVVQ